MGEKIKPQPYEVFKFFEEICTIPHGSQNTKAISDYLVDFARKRNLEYFRDSYNNVIIIKAASPDKAAKSAVAIQGHIDMVCEKAAFSSADMAKDALKVNISGDYIYAEGTTLGGDDGIAVAYMLALLDSPKNFQRLECIFTSDEEIGMIGASHIDLSPLKSKYLINLDSENEGVLTVSCAGGATCTAEFPVKFESVSGTVYRIKLNGLSGGHSGTEINKGRLNGDVMLGKFLNSVSEQFCISEINGGEKDNAIPRSAECILVNGDDIDFEPMIKKFTLNCKKTEPDIEITAEKLPERHINAFSFTDTRNILGALSSFPNGVISMSRFMDNLVETSLSLGIIKTCSESVKLVFSVRSSVEKDKEELLDKLSFIARKFSGCVSLSGDYPPWEYSQNSTLREVMTETYETMYGKKPVVEAIHAGLECGILIGKKPQLDCVSLGPDIKEIHTVRERMSISSVQRVWAFLNAVIDKL